MGKAANARAWAEFERLDRLKQEASFDDEPPLTEEQRAAEWDDDIWAKLDAAPRRVILGDELYAPGLRHVRLGDGR